MTYLLEVFIAVLVLRSENYRADDVRYSLSKQDAGVERSPPFLLDGITKLINFSGHCFFVAPLADPEASEHRMDEFPLFSPGLSFRQDYTYNRHN